MKTLHFPFPTQSKPIGLATVGRKKDIQENWLTLDICIINLTVNYFWNQKNFIRCELFLVIYFTMSMKNSNWCDETGLAAKWNVNNRWDYGKAMGIRPGWAWQREWEWTTGNGRDWEWKIHSRLSLVRSRVRGTISRWVEPDHSHWRDSD